MSDRDVGRSSEVAGEDQSGASSTTAGSQEGHVLPLLDLNSPRGRRWLLRFGALSVGAAVAAPLLEACAPSPAATTAPAVQPTGTSAAPAPQATAKGAESLVPTPVPTKPAAAGATAAPQTSTLQLPVPREEAVVIGAGDETITIPDSWNPFTPRGYQSYAYGWNSALNDMILYHNVEAKTAEEEFVGWIGDKFTYNADYTSWTIHLRKEAHWNDGTPYTSADVKFTYDLIVNNPTLGMRSYILDVKSVEAPDPQTIVVNFTKPYPRYHIRFAAQVGALYVVAKHKWEGQDPQAYKNNPPVTSGPYKLNQVLVDQRQFIYERDPNYWAKDLYGLPKPKYVVYATPPPADLAYEAFSRGFCDYGRQNLTYDVIKRLEDNNPGKIRAIPFLDLCPRALRFNHAVAPTNKLEVRQAIAQMLDRKTAAATLWKPPSRVTSRPFYGGSRMLHFASQTLVDKYDAMYTGDQAKALASFQKAGWTQQGGKLVDSSGTQMKLDIITQVDPIGAEHQMALKLVDDLKKLGVDASFKYEIGAPFTERYQKGNWHVSSAWQCGADPGDPALMYANYRSANIVALPGDKLNTGTNDFYYNNPDYDKMANDLVAMAPDDPKAQALYDQIYDHWMANMMSFPIMETIYTQVAYEQYWKGFPMLPTFFAHPANHHSTLLNIIRKLEPGPLGKAT